MSEVIIRAENLSKRYQLRHSSARAGYQRLSESLVNWAKSPFNWVQRNSNNSPCIRAENPEEFWALKDVQFEVKRGEVLGVVGRNGAGKSTLLKILSRITEPSTGRITLRGRVASLLEVGTGFHPELTGRENIFLNGAILGMTRAEIRSQFDEIVAFAEVEPFLDTPVKRYSSGMYVRLAFAVAAHLEPEILIVDEVLAVGDRQFQQKCLGKMQSVSRGEGRTVLFVSHNLGALRNICQTGLLLRGGKVAAHGTVSEVLARYETGSVNPEDSHLGKFALIGWWIDSPAGPAAPRNSFTLTDPHAPVFCFHIRSHRSSAKAHLGIHLRDASGLLILSYAIDPYSLQEGESVITLRLENLALVPGAYRWQIGLVLEGEVVLFEDGVPELVLDIPNSTHPHPAWLSILNTPFEISSRPAPSPLTATPSSVSDSR
jgi:ABC-type polysaccharide/polyol phosphate transport system ATPase subunit